MYLRCRYGVVLYVRINCYSCCFVKQKTAYEMRIIDWSSDGCSSDLAEHRPLEQQQERQEPSHRISCRQIEAGVDDDQQPDPQDHSREHQPQRIDEEAGGEAEGRHPFEMC